MTIDSKYLNLFIKATEKAAIGASKFIGKKDKIGADKGAVDSMRRELNKINMEGTVVIGEGEMDEAPMLYIGEKLGTLKGPKFDIAVDPLEGTNFTANNMVFVYPATSASTLADVSAQLAQTITIIASIKSVSGTTLTTGVSGGATVKWKTWNGEEQEVDSPFNMNDARAFAAAVSTDKLATWYIPNDGLKLSTYNSLTGRAAETRLKPK